MAHPVSYLKQARSWAVKDCPSPWPAMSMATVVGMLFAFWLLGGRYIFGTSPSWKYPESDTVQHVIGWLQYIKDGWRFPFFYVPTLYYPEGINIILTDSLALMSLVSKIIYKTSGVIVNPFSTWMLICFILQPVTAVLLLRALKIRSPFENFLAIIFSMSLLTFLMRTGTTVMAQFVILFALYFYIRATREPLKVWLWAAQITVLLLTTLVHLYLWGMTFPIFIATIAETVRRKRIRPITGILIFIGTTAATLAFMLACGSIDIHMSAMAIGGFDSFSMNLISPFIPPPSTLFSAPFRHMGFDATGGQVEGFNYLGLGTLLVLATLLCKKNQNIKQAMIENRFLFALMFLFFIYSLSNRIFLGHHLVFHYPVRGKLGILITNSFRASGRFFWPTLYSLVFFGMAAALLWLPRKAALYLVALATALNFIELAPYRDGVQHLREAGVPRPLDEQVWEDLIRGHDRVFQFPSFDCGGLTGQKPWPENYADYQIALTASRAGVPVNSTSSARPFKDCQRERADMTQGKIDDKTLYVFNPLQGRRENLITLGLDPDACRDFGRGVVCSKRFVDDPAFKNNPAFQPLKAHQLDADEQRVAAADKINSAFIKAGSTPKQNFEIAFMADSFYSQFGVLKDGVWITPEDNTRGGYFIYGPYVTVPAGHYIFEIDYALKDGPGKVTWDIAANTGKNTYGTLKLPSTYAATAAPVFGKAILNVTLDADASLLETRVFSEGNNILAVKQILVTRQVAP